MYYPSDLTNSKDVLEPQSLLPIPNEQFCTSKTQKEFSKGKEVRENGKMEDSLKAHSQTTQTGSSWMRSHQTDHTDLLPECSMLNFSLMGPI